MILWEWCRFFRGIKGVGLGMFLLSILVPGAVTARQEPPRVKAGRAEGAIRLDGILDDSAWHAAGVISDLTQQDPHPGQPTPFRTEVRLLVDREHLYIGVDCIDPDPGRIAIHTMQRDGNMGGDDTVTVVLDTFGDGRSGYVFRINAAGAREDGLITNPEDASYDWDGIWDTAVHINDVGWTAEIVIPAQTLRFTPGQDQWGLELQRYIPRDLLTLRWAGTTLDAKLYDVRRAGILAGMAGFHQGMGLSVSPYALGRLEKDYREEHTVTRGTGGFDVTYNFTPGLTGVLTVNTDFAETEVDTRQINLTRFSLFFPEKRDFFLQGSDQFEFGVGLSSYFIPFYSRRVGLYRGEQSPIDFGVKFLGRQGRWGIAALDVKTRDSAVAPGTNLFAGRFTYDATRQLRLGAIVTDGSPDGVSDRSLFGFDAVWSTSTFGDDKNLIIGGWLAGTRGGRTEGRASGWGFRVDYPNDLWDVSLTFNDFGEALDPGLGFLPRPGTRQYRLGAAYRPRPSGGAFGWVRQFHFEFIPSLVENLEGVTESWEIFTAPFNVVTQSGAHIELNYDPQFEYLERPFEIAEGVVIPAGRYMFNRYRVQAETSDSRSWQLEGTVWFGEFYSGHLTQVSTEARWTSPTGHLSLGLEVENDFGRLPQGHFVQRLWQFRAVYAFTPNLVLSSYTQYDSESNDMGVNNRLRWTIKPGRDLFVVWNHGWHRPFDAGLRDMAPVFDQLAVKLRWTFRR